MFSAGSIRSTRARLVGVAVLLGALTFGGLATIGTASAAADPNYVPNGCKAGQERYTTHSGDRPRCDKWPAVVRLRSGQASFNGKVASGQIKTGTHSYTVSADDYWNYVPNGCKAGQIFYQSNNNGSQRCDKWYKVRQLRGHFNAPGANRAQ